MGDFWDLIRDDPELAGARRKLSLHEFRLIMRHARAGMIQGTLVDGLKEAVEGILEDDSKFVSLADQRARWEGRMQAAREAIDRIVAARPQPGGSDE